MNKKVEILLVDDDDMTLFIHEKILNKCTIPFPYRSFTSAESCLNFLNQTDLSKGRQYIILLDINMPSMNGWEMLDEMMARKLDASAYVIMATSSVDKEDRERALKYDCVIDFFEKPLSLDTCERLASSPQIKAMQ
jgi:CheY-like chemotaxis protein